MIKTSPKKDDDIDALSTKRVQYDLEMRLPHVRLTIEEKPTLQCGYEVAYQIAKCKKLHSITEKFIKPCTEKMAKILITLRVKKKIQHVLRSNDTVPSANACQQVCFKIKQSMLQASIQLDESTNITLESHLITFA